MREQLRRRLEEHHKHVRKNEESCALKTNANSQILLLLLHMNLGHASRVDASIAFPVRQNNIRGYLAGCKSPALPPSIV